MDLSLESALNVPGVAGEPSGNIAGRPLDEWNAAYAKVEKLLSRVAHSQQGAARPPGDSRLEARHARAPEETQLSATELAAEEMDLVVTEWFGQVLQEEPLGANHMLSTRGRLALLLVDMPGKWQEQFLHPPPWPEEFIKAMREAYLRAGPDFQLAKMAPRPLDLGPGTISAASGFEQNENSYQISIPVNPGNSGGPMIDQQGAVIGIINGVQTETRGAAFAVKSKVLLDEIESIAQDSLAVPFKINSSNQLAGLSHVNQIKRWKDYVFMVKVYHGK